MLVDCDLENADSISLTKSRPHHQGVNLGASWLAVGRSGYRPGRCSRYREAGSTSLGEERGEKQGLARSKKAHLLRMDAGRSRARRNTAQNRMLHLKKKEG